MIRENDLCVPGDSDQQRRITAFIQQRVPEATLAESLGTEITYQLPDDKDHTKAFEKLFQDLDENLSSLGLSSYGISDTTLEEVFLKVASTSGVDEEDACEEDRRQEAEQLTDGGTFEWIYCLL